MVTFWLKKNLFCKASLMWSPCFPGQLSGVCLGVVGGGGLWFSLWPPVSPLNSAPPAPTARLPAPWQVFSQLLRPTILGSGWTNKISLWGGKAWLVGSERGRGLRGWAEPAWLRGGLFYPPPAPPQPFFFPPGRSLINFSVGLQLETAERWKWRSEL